MKIKKFPAHPFFIVSFQILTVYSINVNEASFYAFLLVLISALLFTGIAYGFISYLIKNEMRAALIISWFGFLFFLYGRLLDLIIKYPIWGFPLERNKYFLPIFIIGLIGGSFLIYKSKLINRNLGILTTYLTRFSLGLVLISMITTGIYIDWTALLLKDNHDREISNALVREDKSAEQINTKKKPNIYFLIFDSYASHSVLEKHYDWDDSTFVNELNTRGFSVNTNARSNYCFTGASINSMLSMRYIHEDSGFTAAYNQDNYIGQFYNKNIVMERFKSEGYRIESNIGDYTFPQKSNISIFTDDFVQLIIHLSMLRTIENELVTDQLREKTLSIINGVKNFGKPDSPTFLLLHIMVPHSPFIFQADGSRPKYFESAFGKFEDKIKFIEQVKFVGTEIIKIVDILKARDPNSIIVLQADHGYGGRNDDIYLNRNSFAAKSNDYIQPPKEYIDARFGILSAKFLPSHVSMPKNVTPVNIFRYLFNALFEDELEILPDKSFFAVIKQPYNFNDVTKVLKESRQ